MAGFKRPSFLIVVVGVLAGVGMLAAKDPERQSRTETHSGKFVIYSNDGIRRMLLARRADQVGDIWSRFLMPMDGPSSPVIIQDSTGVPGVKGRLPITTRIFEGDIGSQKVQIDIYESAVLNSMAYEIEIYRALALQAMYSRNPVRAGKAFRLPPEWVIEGLAEAQFVKENGTPEGVYAAILRSEHPPRIEEVLKGRGEMMDATSLSIYRILAMGLVQALSQQSEGPAGFQRYLESLPFGDAGVKGILAAFPSLENNPSQLNKLWTLALARGSTAKNVQLLTLKETDRELGRILDVLAPADPSKPVGVAVRGAAALPLLARSTGGQYIMRQKTAELLSLELRSHPLLKPIIAEYRAITGELAEKPKRDVMKKLDEVDKIRTLVQQRTDRVSDYINWFEATQLDTMSGQFLEADPTPGEPHRTDPITRYMDAIEERGW